MAQNTILAAGTTPATSGDIVLADGATRTVGLFGTSADLGNIGFLSLMIDTPDADMLVTKLSVVQPAVVISGPGTFRVVRPAVAVAVGVFTEG